MLTFALVVYGELKNYYTLLKKIYENQNNLNCFCVAFSAISPLFGLILLYSDKVCLCKRERERVDCERVKPIDTLIERESKRQREKNRE